MREEGRSGVQKLSPTGAERRTRKESRGGQARFHRDVGSALGFGSTWEILKIPGTGFEKSLCAEKS